MHKFNIFLVFLVLPSAASASMDFFDGGIAYWPKNVKPIERVSNEPVVPEDVPAEFDWSAHLDPNRDEFFREGDYLPPAPFMEVSRRPNEQNIKRWFTYIQRKNEVAARLQQKLQAYLRARGNGLPVDRPKPVPERLVADGGVADDVAIRFYFDSQCPHCRRMFAIVGDLARQGVDIEGRQVDREPVPPQLSSAVPILHVDGEDLAKHGIQSVPQLLIASGSTGRLYRLSGYQDMESIKAAIAKSR